MSNGADVAAAVESLQTEDATWPPPPAGGWEHLPLSLVDTAFSLQARYSRGDAVFPPVARYAARVEECQGIEPGSLAVSIANATSARHNLPEMVELLEPLTTEERLELFASNRPAHTGKDAPRRADTVLIAAKVLCNTGVENRQDFVHALASAAKKPELRSAWMSVPGFGPRSWEYIPLLCGLPGVKADVHVTAFVSAAVGASLTPGQARQLVLDAVETLRQRDPQRGWDLGGVEHLIWRVRSGQPPL